MFYDKFTRLIAYLRGFIAEGSVLSPLNRYLLVRDITFFVTDFYTGDHDLASDLGRLKADELFRLKDREGFLLNLTFSKTRCAGQLRPCSVTYTKCICLPGVLAELFYCRMWGVRCPSSG